MPTDDQNNPVSPMNPVAGVPGSTPAPVVDPTVQVPPVAAPAPDEPVMPSPTPSAEPVASPSPEPTAEQPAGTEPGSNLPPTVPPAPTV